MLDRQLGWRNAGEHIELVDLKARRSGSLCGCALCLHNSDGLLGHALE
jgi:hypothetical protein